MNEIDYKYYFIHTSVRYLLITAVVISGAESWRISRSIQRHEQSQAGLGRTLRQWSEKSNRIRTPQRSTNSSVLRRITSELRRASDPSAWIFPKGLQVRARSFSFTCRFRCLNFVIFTRSLLMFIRVFHKKKFRQIRMHSCLFCANWYQKWCV